MMSQNGWDDWNTSDMSDPWSTGETGDPWALPKSESATGPEQRYEENWTTASKLPQNTAASTGLDPFPTTRSTTARSNLQTLNPEKNVYVGIAQDVQSFPETKRNFVSAWMDSLIYGVPFVNGKVRNIFNLQMLDVEDNLSITRQRSIAVTYFGDMNTGLIGRGQTMQVRGQYGPDHTVYASEICNMTNGSRIDIDKGLPGTVVRLITAAVVLAFAAAITGLPLPGVSGITGFFTGVDWISILLGIVFVLLGIWWLFRILTRPSRTTIIVVGVLLIFLLTYLMPNVGSAVGSIVIMGIGVYILGKTILK